MRYTFVYDAPTPSDELRHYGVKGMKWGKHLKAHEKKSYYSIGDKWYDASTGKEVNPSDVPRGNIHANLTNQLSKYSDSSSEKSEQKVSSNGKSIVNSIIDKASKAYQQGKQFVQSLFSKETKSYYGVGDKWYDASTGKQVSSSSAPRGNAYYKLSNKLHQGNGGR